MIEGHDSVIVRTIARGLVPVAQLFGLYVLVHGHGSPGGGFQAGVILGATYITIALALGREALERRVSEPACVALAAAGSLLFVTTGLVAMAFGGAFLDYGALPLPVSAPEARYLGILAIEVGITLTVAATLIVLFCRLADREPGR